MGGFMGLVQDGPGSIPDGNVGNGTTPGTFGDGSAPLSVNTGSEGYPPGVANSANIPGPVVPADGNGSEADGYAK